MGEGEEERPRMKLFGRLLVFLGLIALVIGLASGAAPHGSPWPWIFLGLFLIAGGMLRSFLVGMAREAMTWLLIACLALPAVALAFEEPTGFQNIPFGSTEGFIGERHSDARCSQRMDQYDDILCMKALSIGDIPVSVIFTLIGKVGARRMIAVDISFAAKNYTALRQAFISVWGMVSPNAFAVLRLITSSNLVGCWTGRSPGLAPLRILST
jgi:hypothetical protein